MAAAVFVFCVIVLSHDILCLVASGQVRESELESSIRYPYREAVRAQMEKSLERTKLASRLRQELGVGVSRNVQGDDFSARFYQDDDVRHALTRLSEIEDISLLSFHDVRFDRDTFKLLSNFHDLKGVRFHRCQFDDSDLAALSQLYSLIGITFTGVPISDEALIHLKPLKSLLRLDLSDTNIRGSTFGHLQELPLQDLNLSATPITDDSLKAISEMHSLQSLTLTNTTISDNGLALLSGLYKLRNLTIIDTKITDAGQAAFMKSYDENRTTALRNRLISDSSPRIAIVDSARITRRTASGSNDGQLPPSVVTSRELMHKFGVNSWSKMNGNLHAAVVDERDDVRKPIDRLSEEPTLEEITIINSPVDGAAIGALAKLPNLRELNLSGCDISEDGLRQLQVLPALKSLDLSYTAVTDKSLNYLKDMKKLEGLRLSYTSITGRTLDQLEKLPLRRVYLMSTPITDEALRSLGRIPTLQVVNLNSTSVTDQGLDHLSNLYKLLDLSIVATDISKEGKQAFVDAQLESRDRAVEQGLLHEKYRRLEIAGP
jgi:Leucine-rich repeat (LRR) protein